MSDAEAVTPDDADDALMLQREHRAAALDGYAELYQAAVGLRALFDQYDDAAREPLEGDQAARTEVVIESYAEAIREHVAVAYPAAVRRSLSD